MNRLVTQQRESGSFFRLFSYWNAPGLPGRTTRAALKVILGPLYKLFRPLTGRKGPKRFQDVWWKGLPMDNEADDRWMQTRFTELWIPLSRTREAMIALRDLYAKRGIAATG